MATGAGAGAASKSLSKNVMAMKFMQRQQEAALREKLKSEQEKVVKDSQWILPASALDSDLSSMVVQVEEENPLTLMLMQNEEERRATEGSAPLGRLSFQNFNPQMERSRAVASSATDAVNKVVSNAQPKLAEKHEAAAQRQRHGQQQRYPPHRQQLNAPGKGRKRDRD